MNVHEHHAAPGRVPLSYLNLAGTLPDQIRGLGGTALIHKIPAEYCRSVEFGSAADEGNALEIIDGRPDGATDKQWLAYRNNAEAVLACTPKDGFLITTVIARQAQVSKTTASRVLQVAEMLGRVVSEYRQMGRPRGYFWRAA